VRASRADDERGTAVRRSDLVPPLVDLYIKQIDFQIYLLPASARGAHDAQREFFCAGACAAICEVKRLYLIISVNRCSGGGRSSLFRAPPAQIRERDDVLLPFVTTQNVAVRS
jgi:hypothetical protein